MNLIRKAYYLFTCALLLGMISCEVESDLKVLENSWWEVEGGFSTNNLNSLEWNIARNEIFYFDGDVIEFINGIQFFPTRFYDFFTPFKLTKDTFAIFFHPEGQYIKYQIICFQDSVICLANDSGSFRLHRINSAQNYNAFKVEDILSLELIMKFDSPEITNEVDEVSIFINFERRTSEASVNGVTMKKQITPFEVMYFTRQLNRIDLSKTQYKKSIGDLISYQLNINAVSRKISLDLGDNSETSIFIKGLVTHIRRFSCF